MELSIKFDTCTVKSGWSIIYIEGSKIIIPKNIIFLSLNDDFVLLQTVQTLMKCCIKWYFIWVFTVCESTHFGVFGVQGAEHT